MNNNNKRYLSDNINTPTGASQACSSVVTNLNNPETKDSGCNIKTLDNNSDENLTPITQGGQDCKPVPVIYVLNLDDSPLMTTNPRKARVLLKKGYAHVVSITPFTIQMNRKTPTNKQEASLGVDAGSKHIGFSATTHNKELYSAEVELRDNIKELLSDRKSFRRTRRNRKTRYRPARFLNRTKPKGWLPPTTQHKLDSHIKMAQQICALLPISRIVVEIAPFNVQQIKNPDIQSIEYQQGEQLGFRNVREYVLYRDKHKCQHCKKKNLKLQVHHIESRKTGGNSPDNLLTLCLECHKRHHSGEIKLKANKKKNFKHEGFMTIVHQMMVDKLRTLVNNVEITYGYITKYNREQYSLEKSHINDAFIISGGTTQEKCTGYKYNFVRRQNRKLHKGKHSQRRNTARVICGFRRYDKVEYRNKECFVMSRMSTGYLNLQKLDGSIIKSSAKISEVKLLEYSSGLLCERIMD